MSLKPEVKWAQRDDSVFLTVQLSEAKDIKLEITPEGKFSFSAKGGPDQKEYAVEIELFGEINVDDSKQLINTQKIFCTMMKKEASDEYWPRLQKVKSREHWLKIDFDKWKDADESEDEDKPDNYDQAGMQGMGGGMPGMGGPPGGGMPGMGGGPGGFDMEAMMKQMQGMGGGGAGGMPDMSEMMAKMGGGGAGGMPDMSAMMGGAGGEPPVADADDEPDSDDEDMPGLE